MASIRDRVRGVAEARVGWIVLGGLALALHMPLGMPLLLALGIPWVAGMVLLARRDASARILGAWRGAVSSRVGAWGAAGLLLTTFGVATTLAAGAALLLFLWLAATVSVLGALRGRHALEEQLAGWALVGMVGGAGLLAAEGVLRLDPVAARLGTPEEIERWRALYDGPDDRNALGFRSRHETFRKDPQVLRVVALGDSYTYGDKIASPDSTWPARLESLWQRREPEAEVEVVNLGQNGFTTVNEAEMLRRVGWQFDPDLVVVQFYLNDVLPSGPDFVREYSEWLFPRPWVLPRRYREGPAGRSALLNVVESLLTRWRWGDRSDQAAVWTELYRRRGPEWESLAGALREMSAAAAVRGVPIVLMLLPDFIPGLEAGEEPPFGEIHAQVGELAARNGYSVVDLTPTFLARDESMRHWWATPFDAHPGPEAAGVIAERLLEHLLEVLEPGAPPPNPAPERP